MLIPLLLVAAVWYFFLGGKDMLGGFSQESTSDQFSLGASLSEEKFDQAQVFEPLAYGFSGNALPRSVSLLSNAPRRLHQGNQGSCVGWASAYAARTILQSKATGQSPDQLAFSPAYLYNQIALSGCEGAYMVDAMKAMSQNGAVPFQQFRYDDRDCSRAPNGQLVELGRQFRIKGYNRLTQGADEYAPDILAIKQNLAQGAPVVIGMMVGGSFMSRMLGQKMWYPTQSDYSMRGFGGHAMCVIGYDDNLEGGAFQIMNSWGEDWGDRGIGWVRYRDFEHFTKEAYGLSPLGSANAANADKMQVEFGLYDTDKQSIIALAKKDDMTFRTVTPMRKGSKFKVLIANSIECYTYVFGQETDGSSYVLFPYTEKHSPYCGITGTRLFPKDYSMTPDEVGNKDFIAIVVSKKELDYNALNRAMTASRQSTYAGKLRDALANQRITQVQFQASNTVSFSADAKDKTAVGMVMEIDKN
ncbi:MAG: peptidase C1 [Saprospiraceae bacterium]|nr:peptidase C1 [Saprospiraceae bacterium]